MAIRDTFIQEDGFGFVPRPNRDKHNGKFDIVRRYALDSLVHKNKKIIDTLFL